MHCRLHWQMVVASALAVLLVIGAVVTVLCALVAWHWAVLGLFLLGTAVLPFVFVATARRHDRLQVRLRHLLSEPERILARRQHAAAEAARLTYFNEQLIDWGDVIATVLHRPWGAGQKEEDEGLYSVGPGTMAFATAVPAGDDAAEHGEVLRLRSVLMRPGWLSNAFALGKGVVAGGLPDPLGGGIRQRRSGGGRRAISAAPRLGRIRCGAAVSAPPAAEGRRRGRATRCHGPPPAGGRPQGCRGRRAGPGAAWSRAQRAAGP